MRRIDARRKNCPRLAQVRRQLGRAGPIPADKERGRPEYDYGNARDDGVLSRLAVLDAGDLGSAPRDARRFLRDRAQLRFS